MTEKNLPSKSPPVYYSPKSVFVGGPSSGACVWFDENALVAHTGTITSNNGTSLVVSSKSTSFTYDLTGDGTQCIPVSVLVSP